MFTRKAPLLAAIFNTLKQPLTIMYKLTYEGMFLEWYAERKVRWCGDNQISDCNLYIWLKCQTCCGVLPGINFATPSQFLFSDSINSGEFIKVLSIKSTAKFWDIVKVRQQSNWEGVLTAKTPPVKLEQLSVHVDHIPLRFSHWRRIWYERERHNLHEK